MIKNEIKENKQTYPKIVKELTQADWIEAKMNVIEALNQGYKAINIQLEQLKLAEKNIKASVQIQ